MTEQPKADPNELNIQDLATCRAIIELATERNTFKVTELASVGALYNKLDNFLKAVEEQAKAAREANAAAQMPPSAPADENGET